MNLREATAAKHKEAETMPFNQRMISGQMSADEYSLWLRNQYHIFNTIESTFGLPHTAMFRSELILDDLTELGIIDITPVGQATNDYCEYLRGLNYDTVYPHIYLNYMAIMMGGQLIKSKVVGSGRMYEFDGSNTIRDIVAIISKNSKDEWIGEVNKGYEFVIAILKELNNIK